MPQLNQSETLCSAWNTDRIWLQDLKRNGTTYLSALITAKSTCVSACLMHRWSPRGNAAVGLMGSLKLGSCSGPHSPWVSGTVPKLHAWQRVCLKFHLRTAFGISDITETWKIPFSPFCGCFCSHKTQWHPLAEELVLLKHFVVHRNNAVPGEYLSKQTFSTAPPVTSN